LKTILIFSNDHAYTYNFRKEIIEKLLSEGYKVYVALPYGEGIEKLKKMGCEFIEVSLNRRGKNPIQDLELLWTYIKILKKIKPSVVLTYTLKPNLYGSIASQIINVPHINNITGLGSAFLKDNLIKRTLLMVYKVALKKSDCVFFQNTSDLKFLKDNKIVKGNAKLIPGSGVNLSEFNFSELSNSEKIKFLYIGRIMKDKGIEEFLQAAKNIKKKFKNTEFEVLGYVEPTQKEYTQQLKNLHDNKIINYLGYQKNVKPIIEDTHCIIQPSHGGEGISNVLLESGAMGKLLIASNIPGCRETIDDEKNGFLFEPKDHIHLEKVIEKVLKLNFSQMKAMGVQSRKKVEVEFDRTIVVNEYIKEINKITSKG